jgi:hypothetical protein
MPNLTFFCELDPLPLRALFSNTLIPQQLQRLKAGVSLGILDFSPERAAVAQYLNQHGIPLTAWLLLPKDQGYWFNLDNAPLAYARYADFRAWSTAHDLRWEAVGLDIEPDIAALQTLAAHRARGLRQFLRRANRSRLAAGKEIYQTLVREIQAAGLRVESYQFPFIVDERRAGSRLVQRLTGVLDLPVDREVLMLYSSFYPSIGAGMLASYGQQAGGIGLGSTGGGVTMDGLVDTRSLSLQDFRRDLLLAARRSPHLYIFSLEGCVEQGFLPYLLDFDWTAPIKPPTAQVIRVNIIRALARLVLTISRLFL